MRSFLCTLIIASVAPTLGACAHTSDGAPSVVQTSGATDEGASCVVAKFSEDPNAPQMCSAQCERRDAESCTTLGAMYAQGHLVGTRDDAKAAASYSRGCELGDLMGCHALGKLTKDSDPKTALTAFERVCRSKEDKDFRQQTGEACAFTGAAYAEGSLVTKDVKRATDDLTKSCGMGHIASCDRLDFKPRR